MQRYKHGHNRMWGVNTEKYIKFAETAPNWRGGKTKNIYVYIHKPDHPRSKNGYVAEHILVMEKHLGRFLTKIEQIHHKNFNKEDNRLSNLRLMSSNSDHRKLHGIITQKNIKKEGRICSECKSTQTYYRKSRNSYEWFKDGVGGYLCKNDYKRLRYKSSKQ